VEQNCRASCTSQRILTPQKKYPVIFYYYERRSDALNLCLIPKASDAPINIPLFVSNGYLVFSPDIRYK
jgi:hypothetical protein